MHENTSSQYLFFNRRESIIYSYYHQNNKVARDGTFKTNENECCAIPFLFYSTFLKVDNCSY